MPNDLVVVLPGITGTTLRSRRGAPLWSPTPGAILDAITSFGRSLHALRLPEGIGDDHPGDGVEPVALMNDLHLIPGIWTPVRGYDRLLARLRSLGYRESTPAAQGNLLPLPYDWRLSNRYNANRLAKIVEPALERWRAAAGGPEAQLSFVCHSMGGLVARWYIEKCGGAAHTRKLITLGTPYRGAAKALDQLVNGAHQRLGPLSFDLTAFARTLPSLHQLLPEYACIEDPATGALAKTTEHPHIPDLDRALTHDAMRFHTDLRAAELARPASLAATHAIVGTQQNSPTTARVQDGRLTVHPTYAAGLHLYGDGTVPLVAACREDVPMDSNMLRRVPDHHGNLQRNKAALDEVTGVLTGLNIPVRAPGRMRHLRLDVPELSLAGEELVIRLGTADGTRIAVLVTVRNEVGTVVESQVVVARPEPAEVRFNRDGGRLRPGAYTVDATGKHAGSPVAPVSADTLVWP
ncbi:hypothetical protein [Streptomyces sp. NPDC000983]|uniref:esterase/lipase family protein n=1 Tax=Streptomyces sp. NPDC000983 TaxID=3154373 RepID=UPI00331EAFF5